jgi:hypothetical protein|tara:strand:- start:410 stop:664 length:255 start_codon:yes stop_codon:yes gene_type:complete
MSKLKENRYIIKSNSYLIDLYSVDFITWKENEQDLGSYRVKFHIGNKDARYICDIETLRDILEEWSNIRGKKIGIELMELKTWD